MFKWLKKFRSTEEKPKNEILISKPTNFTHYYHAGLDSDNKNITGLPEKWDGIISDRVVKPNMTSRSISSPSNSSLFSPSTSLSSELEFDNIHNSVARKNSAPCLPERKPHKVEGKIKKKSGAYQNVNIKSTMDSINCEATALEEIRKMCYHEDEKAFENYEEEEIPDAISKNGITALDKSTQQKVSIKTIDLNKTKTNKAKLILNELLILKKIKNENVVCFIDAFFFEAPEKILKIVMEHMDGGCLTDVIEKIVLTEPQIAAISYEVLKGLDYLHDQNIIHRNIKSDKILLHTNGSIKIADMICSKNINVDEKRSTTVGTVYWMSPELLNRTQYNKKTDIWSFGILTTELIQGHPPNFDLSPAQATLKIVSEERLEIKNFERLSKRLQDLIDRCLDVDQKMRASCAELMHHDFFQEACNLSFLKAYINTVKQAS